MGLNSFVTKEARPLPIFILADTSGSMNGDKINNLNLSLREMLNSLKSLDDIRGKFQLCVISFGPTVKVVQELADIENISLPEMAAGGSTPMGAAFELVKEMIENRSIVSSRAYTPTIVLVSDGMPMDCSDFIYKNKKYLEWEPLRELQNGARSSKCQRLALGVGLDVDTEMLKQFINNDSIPVIKTENASGITKFFKWVTMSTIARMNSVNPNEPNVVAPVFDIDEEDIVI